MPIYKGGRGKKAPYESVVVRVPKPLEEKVNQIILDFRDSGLIEEQNKFKLTRDILESLAKKHSKKLELAKNWQAFIDEVLSLIK